MKKFNKKSLVQSIAVLGLVATGALISSETSHAEERVWQARSVEQVKADINGNNVYTIKWGDTLSVISEATNLTVQLLQDINNITNADLIYEGNTLTFSGNNVKVIEKRTGDTIYSGKVNNADKVDPKKPIGNPNANKPTTGGSTGTTTNKPTTGGSTGTTTNKPTTGGSTGTTTNKPTTGGSTGTTTNKPTTGGSTGTTTDKPTTGGSTGTTTDKPTTGGGTGTTTPQEKTKWGIFYTADSEFSQAYNIVLGDPRYIYDTEDEAIKASQNYSRELIQKYSITGNFGYAMIHE